MKKTLNVNIGSMAFIIDEDAYFTLNGYYDDIRSRLYEEDRKEIMDDIETRTCDIFRDNMSYTGHVVTIDMVKRAIAIIGNAQTFGERKYDNDYSYTSNNSDTAKKLYRSRSKNIIGGVCGGLSDYLNVDVTIIRLLMFFLVFLGGLSLFVYIIMWIIIPMEPAYNTPFGYDRNNRRRV